MPMIKVGALKSRGDVQVSGRGFISETFPQTIGANASTPATQIAYGTSLGLRAGDSVTGFAMGVAVAAAGTSPTTIRIGLADSTGKVLAVSGNLNSAAFTATGVTANAFSAPYTVPSEGLYYGCLLVNGTWGTTQPTLLRGPAALAVTFTAFSTFAPAGFQWTGQTDLPAVNSSLTITTGPTPTWWMAAY